MNEQCVRTLSIQHGRFLRLLAAVALFVAAVVLLLAMVGPALVLPAYRVQAQDVHALAVAVDGAVSAVTTNTVSAVGIPHTTGTGTNRLMLVGVSWNCGTTNRSISSVQFSYGSGPTVVSLDPVRTEQTGTQYRYAAIYSLLDPPVGETGTVTVTFSGSVSNGIIAGAANFAGVDQTTPLGVSNGANASSAAPSVTLTGLNGDELVFDTVFQGASGSSQTLTVGPDQTELTGWNLWIGNARASASTEEAAGSSVTMSWTAASSSYWAIVAVAINPAPVGPTHDLTVTVDPAGAGTTNPAAGVHPYPENTVVTVTAAANVGYTFDHWAGACTGSGACQVTMDADKAVTATFAAIPQYTLTATDDGHGSVTLNPAGGTYYAGTTVTLTVTPADCYVFNNWSGANSGDVVDTAGVYTILMSGNKTVQANFSALPQYTLTAGNNGHGSVTLDPAGGTYCISTTVTLTPVPDSGYVFDHWSGTNSGDIVDTGGVYTIVMNGNKTVQANFAIALWPTLDGAASSGTALPNASSISFSHTTGTGTNRLMLVGVSWNCGSTNQTISSITFTPEGGSAITLTEVWTELYNWSTNYRYTAIYSLLGPASGVSGTVSITFSGAVSNGIIAGAANFAGVDQTTPLGTPDGAVGTGNNTSGTPNPAVTLTGLAGDELVFDSVFIGVSSTSHAITADSGQSELWNVSGYSLSSSFNALGAASTKGATGTSATMSWTTVDFGTTTTRWAIAAVPINPAPASVTCYTLTLGHTGNGTTPTASPTNSTGCPTGQYTSGENISLSGATADLGWGIRNWYGTSDNASEAITNSLTMPASVWEAGVNFGRLLGDVNSDGAVNSTDALIVLTADAGIATPGFCPMNYGDVNGNGLVNSTDALIILTYDVGLPVGTFPVGHAVAEPVLSSQPPGCGGGGLGLSRWSRAPLTWLLSVAQLDVK
jgi:hypothetical protein